MEENCYVQPIQKNVSEEESQKIERVFLAVWGMGCLNCATRIRNSLLSQNGVVYAFVDHTNGIAGVDFNPDLVTVEVLLKAVANAGNHVHHEYSAQLLSTEVSS